MDNLSPLSLNVLDSVSDSNMLRLQVEDPELWQRLFVGDLVKHKTNLLQYARYIRAELQVEKNAPGSVLNGRKRKVPSKSFMDAVSKPPSSFFGLALSPFDLSVPHVPDSTASCGLNLSLSPFEVGLEPDLPLVSPLVPPSHSERTTILERRMSVLNTPPPFTFSVIPQPSKPSKGKENAGHLRVDTEQPEDDHFAARQLVQLQLTPPSLPRRRLRSLSPSGHGDPLALLAKTCCQEKPGALSFFSFSPDDACPKRFKAMAESNKFDKFVLAVNNFSQTEIRTPTPKSKSKGRRTRGTASKKRRVRKMH